MKDKLTIKRMAINVIDLTQPKPKISDELFPLDGQSNVVEDFFKTHFKETRSGKSTKNCKFFDEDATIKTKIKRFSEKNNDSEFIHLSNQLTENLFNIMKSTTSTSSGTYFVFDVLMGDEDCLFLIKLDPKKGVQMDYNDLSLRVLENILPDSNDRVHKCAIIRYNKMDDYQTDLFVMDKQQREGEPAKFFLETYLQAQELLNDKIISKEVIRESRVKLSNILPEIDDNEIYNSIDNEFSNGSKVNLKTSIKNILSDCVPQDLKDRELFIENQAELFETEYISKYPNHQTSFQVERRDALVTYRAEKDQIYFRYNKGIRSKVDVKENEKGNTIIEIDKTLNLKRDL